MKNILLLTSLYPCPDIKILSNTAVCHYFAKEWMQLGYNVKVIFTYNVYPKCYYPVLRVLRNYLVNKLGIAIQYQYIGERKDYIHEGVNVSLLPIHKPRPGGGFEANAISDVLEEIKGICKEENYVPDIVLAHFTHPGLELATALKEEYKIPCAVSLHGPEPYSEYDKSLFAKCDYVGFRSYPTRWAFEKSYGSKPFFMCPSGVPESFIKHPRIFKAQPSSFIFVGTLMERKYPATLIPAISKNYKGEDFSIKFIGDGADKSRIIKVAKDLDTLENLQLLGRIPRNEVTRYLDQSDVFIMISKYETFGLVYLEAMARGCIVVASKNEGMDGIIDDGVNGFLCEAGNETELAEVVLRIKKTPLQRLSEISSNAITTAKRYTDYNVAKEYIETFKY